MEIPLPEAYSKYITSDTAVFYYSPTCSHCQAVIPEINALAKKHDLPWIGVAVGSSSPKIIVDFRQGYQVLFVLI